MKPIIELNAITVRYTEEDRPALKNVSLSIEQGEWVALIGHNGSGKSTLAKTINGLILPQEGALQWETCCLMKKVFGISVKWSEWFSNPDNQFVGSTVEDDVAFGLENQGIPRDEMVIRVKNALEQVRMEEFATREPARLSGGQKQRVAIAGVVALRPDIIILDEATSMLDPEGREEVIQRSRKSRKKII